MQPVDFDEDGDVDLFLGRTGRGLGTLPPCSAYFERSSADLVQRDVNPMSQFDNAAAYVVQIVDVDGDGRLDVIQERRHSLDYAYRSRLRYFRRSHDGSFVEPVENPLREIDEYVRSIHVTDWNSDGLPDIVMVQTSGNEWKIENYYQHVLNLDMKYNSYFTSYEDIMPGFRRHLAINWNKDGWHDVVLLPDSHNNVEIEAAYISWVEGRSPARPPPLGLYEVNQLNVREVGTASQLKWSSSLLVVGLGTLAGSLAFFWRRRQSRRTPLWKRRRQFLQEWPLRLKPCERGPDRSITAGELQDFAQFFEAFIKERSMYYVCSNLVKPLTEPYQLSFVELATCEEDRQMICDLIEAMPGGFDAMNNYVRETILEALEASHQHYESTFKGLIRNLTSRVAFARAANDATSLPRLLGAARAFKDDLEAVLARAARAHVRGILVCSSSPADVQQVIQLRRRHPELQICLGLHPLDCSFQEEWNTVRAVIANEHLDQAIAGLGEMLGTRNWGSGSGWMHLRKAQALGLTEAAVRQLQVKSFEAQLQLAEELQLPVNVHSRNAEAETLEILERYKSVGVMHAYKGPAWLAAEAAQLGRLYFSFPPSLVYKWEYQEAVKALPLERLLLETDSPSLGSRGPKARNEPGFIREAAQKMAELKGLTVEEVAAVTTRNALQLFPALAQQAQEVQQAESRPGRGRWVRKADSGDADSVPKALPATSLRRWKRMDPALCSSAYGSANRCE
eukprot:g6100.t2